MDAKCIPLLLHKVSLLHHCLLQNWVLQNLGGALKLLEVGATCLDEVSTAQVGDTKLVQVSNIELVSCWPSVGYMLTTSSHFNPRVQVGSVFPVLSHLSPDAL